MGAYLVSGDRLTNGDYRTKTSHLGCVCGSFQIVSLGERSWLDGIFGMGCPIHPWIGLSIGVKIAQIL